MTQSVSTLSSRLKWLPVGSSFASVIAAWVVLGHGDETVVVLKRALVHFTPQPALINLLVAMSALGVAGWMAWRRRTLFPAKWLAFLLGIALVGLFASLGYRDDYTGGSCGAFDWPAGHLHAGYPYSWLDGEICVAPHTSIHEYVAQHPQEAGWFPDFLALGGDGLFWVNIGILGSALGEGVLSFRKQKISPPAP